MPDATQTAVIIPVAPAEAVVGNHRRRLDPAAIWGVPAHVTVVYPFVPPRELDKNVIQRLGAVFAAVPAFACTFDRCEWFGDDVLWLAPARDQVFRDLTNAVVERFPGYRPYGGQFAEPIPHLTVGGPRLGTLDDLKAAEADIHRKLPIAATIERALLIAGTDQPDSWRTVCELPLGSSQN